MSRTYRRTKRTHDHRCRELYATHEWVKLEGYQHWYHKPLVPGTKKYKKALAEYHSDSGTWSFKEPGPAWFRNMFTERPMRRLNRSELKKFIRDPSYEPMVYSKYPLEYWT